MRVAFFGNNLNYGSNFVRKLRDIGYEAHLWAPWYAAAQDTPEWWSRDAQAPSWFHKLPQRLSGWSVLPHQIDPDVRELHERARGFDLLLLMEHGPALFAGFNDVPKIFVSQGHDLQDLPFLVPDRWLERTVADIVAIRQAGPDSLRAAARALTAPVPRLVRWTVMQARQRRGIRECARSVVLPYQGSIATRLGVPPESVAYLQFVVDEAALVEIDEIHERTVLQQFGHFGTVFFHPTRHQNASGWSTDYTKDNLKLIEAYANFAQRGPGSSHVLILARKGEQRDLVLADELVRERGIASHVHWLDEIDHVRLMSYYRLPNVVVCDQFGAAASMGNIGREASFVGRPLITSLAADLAVLYPHDSPPHVTSVDTVDGIARALDATSQLTASERAEMATRTRQWATRHLSGDALMNRYKRLIDACA